MPGSWKGVGCRRRKEEAQHLCHVKTTARGFPSPLFKFLSQKVQEVYKYKIKNYQYTQGADTQSNSSSNITEIFFFFYS
jgi:hypothetical protein